MDKICTTRWFGTTKRNRKKPFRASTTFRPSELEVSISFPTTPFDKPSSNFRTSFIFLSSSIFFLIFFFFFHSKPSLTLCFSVSKFIGIAMYACFMEVSALVLYDQTKLWFRDQQGTTLLRSGFTKMPLWSTRVALSISGWSYESSQFLLVHFSTKLVQTLAATNSIF